ncbi:MAG: alanine/glycine:cation symporter family protein [Verrucomicrobiota bacterium]
MARNFLRILTLFAIAFSLFCPPEILAQEEAVESIAAATAEEEDKGIDEVIDGVFGKVAGWIFGVIFYKIGGFPIIIAWLVTAATIFTFYFGFVNFRKFGLAIGIVSGKYSDPKEKGEVSHFQALTAALSGTVGLGNIAGVAVAVSAGGPGATFWMIIAGLLGMSSKFVECTLGVRYREIDSEGRVYGGPMYYLSKGVSGFGKPLAIIFAVFCIGGALGGGNMFQVNQAYTQLNNVMGGNLEGWGWLFGLFIASIVGLVIIGGIRSIARATSKIVPIMCGIYVLAAICVLLVNFSEVPAAFSSIFTSAFSAEAAGGGILGALIVGFQRAAFSNEAGIGSASIAHSAVKTNNPASEGLVSLLEPFIDTVVVCTMTALAIIVSGQHLAGGGDGVELTSNAFQTVIPWFDKVLVVAVTLFAFSTMISWSYYGEQAWCYLFGTTDNAKLAFKIVFCLFVIVGSASSLNGVLDFSDAMILAMSFPNIIGLYFLMPKVK